MAATSAALALPRGKSQSTWTATVGQQPVNRCTWPASLNFSSVEVAAAACWNLPKRVPVLAKPQEGSSMQKPSRALKILSSSEAGMADLLRILIITALAGRVARGGYSIRTFDRSSFGGGYSIF